MSTSKNCYKVFSRRDGLLRPIYRWFHPYNLIYTPQEWTLGSHIFIYSNLSNAYEFWNSEHIKNLELWRVEVGNISFVCRPPYMVDRDKPMPTHKIHVYRKKDKHLFSLITTNAVKPLEMVAKWAPN